MPTPALILDFWFAEITPAQWWAKSDDFDRLVEARFGAVLQAAAQLLDTGRDGSASAQIVERNQCQPGRPAGQLQLAAIAVLQPDFGHAEAQAA